MRAGGGRGTGITALFAGDSGTGKTMSAEAIAAELGLDLYTVNLATVIDKYVGETEKNLERIFAEASGVNAVLLFDEADAIFGKRSEVRDAHDRYANIESAYLLQRMETFDGLAVLATNLRANIDDAFTRRLDAIVDFPEPSEPLRLELWRRCLAPPLPVRRRRRPGVLRARLRAVRRQHPLDRDNRRVPCRRRRRTDLDARRHRGRPAGVPQARPARRRAGIRELLDRAHSDRAAYAPIHSAPGGWGMGYRLGVDIGTTYTAAAVYPQRRERDSRPRQPGDADPVRALPAARRRLPRR